MQYFMKIKPLEPYSFGGEQGFAYPGETLGKESYFVRSEQIPNQTTILGMLRYAILSHTNQLHSSFDYQEDEQKQMAKYIGPASFSFTSRERQEFGVIRRISPVFLCNEKDEILIRNPFHNCSSGSGYVPMEMESRGFQTGQGEIRLPRKEAYDAKKGYGAGYINISSGRLEIEYDLFHSLFRTGNRKNNKQGREEDAFFKQELFCLKPGYSFGVFVDLKEEIEGIGQAAGGAKPAFVPEQMILPFGKKRAMFQLQCSVSDQDLEEMVKQAFAAKNRQDGGAGDSQAASEKWYYALSDLYLDQSICHRSFAIVEKKYQRNLQTVHRSGKRGRLKKTEERLELISSGSVFYGGYPEGILAGQNASQIGYNRIIELGGK